MRPRVLFILKKHAYGKSYGLFNSCEFVAGALRGEGIEASTAEVDDNNDIDRVVHHFRPTHVIIEALWVVPSKFTELIRLHPHVKWSVRVHSNMPFLSGEGMALEWIREYFELSGQLGISANSDKLVTELFLALNIEANFLPNVYLPSLHDTPPPCRAPKTANILDVGCFGAIRPLKNQLEQAVAAMIYANANDLVLNFHVNTTRVEQNSDPIVKNLQALFFNTDHILVSHPWLQHDEFVHLVRRMDCGLQLSFSETFNIVAADFIHNEVPFVGSSEIPWLHPGCVAEPTKWKSIADGMDRVINTPRLMRKSRQNLRRYSLNAVSRWLAYLNV